MTLIEHVSKYLLRYRKITPAKAYVLFGTMRLSSIISDLRKRGWPIETIYIEKPNRWGQKIRYGVYTLRRDWYPEDEKKSSKK